MEVTAKIEVRKKKAEERKGFNDVTDLAKLNSDYSIDNALAFVEGRLHRKQKSTAGDLKKGNKQLEKKKKKKTRISTKEDIEACSPNDEKVKVCNTAKTKNKCKPKKMERSNRKMFDEIVGDAIDQLGSFVCKEQAKSKKCKEIVKTEKIDVNREDYFEGVETAVWTKVRPVCDRKRKVKKEESKAKKPEPFTLVDVEEHKNLKTVSDANARSSPNIKCQYVKNKIWEETVFTTPDYKNKILSEEDFPSLETSRKTPEKKGSSKKKMEKYFSLDKDLEEVCVKDETVKVVKEDVFDDVDQSILNKEEILTKLEMDKEELPAEFDFQFELCESSATHLKVEVNIQNQVPQEDFKSNEKLKQEKCKEQQEKRGEEVERESRNQDLEEGAKKLKEDEAKKPSHIQISRMHAMLSGLIVPFGQF